jgi:hypothetical protein
MLLGIAIAICGELSWFAILNLKLLPLIPLAGAGLESPRTATTVSVRDGKRQVHDGPYAETKEFLAGFVIIDVPNLDAALEWAARNPAA